MHNNFQTNIETYLRKATFDLKEDLFKYRAIFYILNIISLLFASATTIMTTIFLSKIFGRPDWYFFATTGLSAFVALFTSVINFFYIKDRKVSIAKKIYKLESLKVSYGFRDKHSDAKRYNYFLKIASILDNEAAKKELTGE